MISEILIMVMEWIGTVAFAVSGSLVAVSCSLDLFGVITVGCITAVGGGMIRDLLVGNIPPQIFFNLPILLVAIATSILVFIIAYLNRKKFQKFRQRIETLNVFFDALGLATFSVTGVEIARVSDYADNAVLAVTLGVITGVGGGVLRDVLVNEKPYILTRHIYAVASIVCCGVYYVMSVYGDYHVIGTIVSLALTITIRLCAAKFHWGLPKIKVEDDTQKESEHHEQKSVVDLH